MSAPPAELLQRLGSGIVPTEPSVSGWRSDSGGPDFTLMLTQARRGDLETGLPVDLSAEPALTLSNEQHQRLSAAIDRLAASDARHALVLLDGLALLADPNARRVTGTAHPGSGTPVVGIDSMVTAVRGGATPARSAAPLDPTHPFRALTRISAEPSGDNL